MMDKYHGSLWEVPLGENLGFAYVQMIDMDMYNMYGWFLKIFNHRSETSVQKKKISDEEFNSWDLLTSSVVTAGTPPRRGDGKWKSLGIYPLSEEDLVSPLFKAADSHSLDYKKGTWTAYNGPPSGTRQSVDWSGLQFEQVEHLSFYNPVVFLHAVPVRLTMEWMKYLGIDFENYSPPKTSLDHLEAMKTHVRYGTNFASVPKNIRGKIKPI